MWGAILSAFSSVLGNNASKRAGAESARGELQEAESTAKMIRKRTKENRSSAVAALAASGVDIGDGTSLIIDSEITQRGEEDALAALLTGKRRAKAAKYGGQVQGQQYLLQGAGSLANAWIKNSGNGGGSSYQPRSSATVNSLAPQTGSYNGGGYNA